MDYYQQLKKRDGDLCHYCRLPFGEGELAISLDHLIPKSEGGKRRHDNLVICHKKCNLKRGTIPYETFLSSNPPTPTP